MFEKKKNPLFFALCLLLLLLCLVTAFALAVSGAVRHKTADRIRTVEEAKAEEPFDCILVLGCAVTPDGGMSTMLEDRVNTAITLYQSGVSQTFLMSGDSQDAETYDEVGTMKQALLETGIPAEDIQTDPLGLSTYESIANLAEKYKGKRVLIVTQQYHLYRALYIAEKMGVDAYGTSADLRTYQRQSAYSLREIAARCKDVFWIEKNYNS